MSYETKNTDCRDFQRNGDGFEALAMLMRGELRKFAYYQEDPERKKAGICQACKRELDIVYRVVDQDTGKLIEVKRGDFERIAKIESGALKGNLRFLVFHQYYCDCLLDRWFRKLQNNGTMKQMSPVDRAFEIAADEKRDALAGTMKNASGGLGRL
jgi:hypothetical protein